MVIGLTSLTLSPLAVTVHSGAAPSAAGSRPRNTMVQGWRVVF